MKNPTPLLLALALVGGGAAGAAAALLVRSAPAETAEDALVVGPESGSAAELLERLDALAAENRALREQLAALELRPAAEPRTPVVPLEGFVPLEEFERFREDVQRSLAGLGSLPREPVAFREQVADALSTIRKEERVDAVRGYQEKRVARLDQDVAKLDERLGLSPYQSGEMRNALLAQYEREAEVRRLWEEGADDGVLGEQKRVGAETFQADLQSFLSPEQLELFWSEVRQAGGK